MRCSNCNAEDTKVIDSRILQEGEVVRRRRKCEACQKRFTTYERLEIQMPEIIKKDGRREIYRREKLLFGVKKACQKRPIPVEAIDHLAISVEKIIIHEGAKEIPSQKLGEMVIERLYHLDPVAYIRFASNYWHFNDIDDFVKNLQRALKLPARLKSRIEK